MAVVVGVDEAGLGPVLGPLVVSGAAFRVPDERVGDCLWTTLRGSCTKRVTRRPRRLVVADSKKLYSPAGSLGPLERTALVMLAAAGARPGSFRELVESVAPGAVPLLDEHPWYRGEDLALPVCEQTGDIGTRAHAVIRDCAREDVEPAGLVCEPLAEGRFNGLIAGVQNKSTVVADLAMRVVDRLLRAAGERRARVHVDRLGGRAHYRQMLQTAFPGFEFAIVEESPQRSAYLLTNGDRRIEIDFSTAGEQRHFAVALASVLSKYVRELHMRLFNRYWSSQAAGLAPTAGYYTDAQRWLRDAAPHIERLGIDRSILVRAR